MIRSRMPLRWLAASVCSSLVLLACGGGDDDSHHHGMTYVATSLVTDVNSSSNPYSGDHVDSNLVNSWGIAFNPQGFVWVANAGTSTSTLYDGNGVPQTLIVDIPPGTAGSASPTGIVFNRSSDFVVSQGGASGASAFIFVGEAGTVSGWSPSVNLNAAVKVVDRGAAGAIYKGLALAASGGANFLYATDFHNGTVDIFDATFTRVTPAGAFVDPNLPAGYAPFGIQAIGDQIVVTYAHLQQRAAGRQFRRRQDPCVRRHDGCIAGHAGQARRRADRHRGAVGHRLRQRHQCAADQHAVLRRRPGRRDPRCVRPDRRPLAERHPIALTDPRRRSSCEFKPGWCMSR
jgi:hypothetical protein